MKVSDLRLFLASLCEPVRSSGGAKVAANLENVLDGLSRFDNYSWSEFAEFLARAESYDKTGIIPVASTKSRKPKQADDGLVRRVAGELVELYERAIGEATDYSHIRSRVAEIGKRLSAAEAKQVAKEFGIEGSIRTKKAAIQEIERKITERKESYQRVQF